MMEGGTEAWVSGLRLVRFRRNSHSSTERPACKGRGGGRQLVGVLGDCAVVLGSDAWCGGRSRWGGGGLGKKGCPRRELIPSWGREIKTICSLGWLAERKPLGVDWVLWTGHCTLCTTKVGLMKA